MMVFRILNLLMYFSLGISCVMGLTFEKRASQVASEQIPETDLVVNSTDSDRARRITRVKNDETRFGFDPQLNMNVITCMLWSEVDIPKGAVIRDARLTVTARGASSGQAISLKILGDVSDAVSLLEASDSNLSLRSSTKTVVAWNDLDVVFEGTRRTSPSVHNILEEMTSSESNWVEGSQLVICINKLERSDNSTTFRNFHAGSQLAPELRVEFDTLAPTASPTGSINLVSSDDSGNVTVVAIGAVATLAAFTSFSAFIVLQRRTRDQKKLQQKVAKHMIQQRYNQQRYRYFNAPKMLKNASVMLVNSLPSYWHRREPNQVTHQVSNIPSNGYSNPSSGYSNPSSGFRKPAYPDSSNHQTYQGPKFRHWGSLKTYILDRFASPKDSLPSANFTQAPWSGSVYHVKEEPLGRGVQESSHSHYTQASWTPSVLYDRDEIKTPVHVEKKPPKVDHKQVSQVPSSAKHGVSKPSPSSQESKQRMTTQEVVERYISRSSTISDNSGFSGFAKGKHMKHKIPKGSKIKTGNAKNAKSKDSTIIFGPKTPKSRVIFNEK